MPSAGAMAEAARRIEALAPTLVKSAKIQPGQLVTIHGGPQMVSAMEALAIEVQKTGGSPVLLLDSPKVIHSYFAEAPDTFLGKTPKAWKDFQATGVDVEFGLPVFENFLGTLADVPPERQGKVFAAFTADQSDLTARQNRNQTRRLNFVSPPGPADAEAARVDAAAYSRMYYAGLDADYTRIAEQGRKIQQALKGARKVRITTPSGTNLTFAVGDRPVILDAGMAAPGTGGLLAARTGQLPGGSLRLAPVETSVTGVIKAPRDQCNLPVTDEVIEVSGGMPGKVSAASDEACVKEAVARAGRFGWVQIGLNPALRVTNPDANLASTLLDLGAGAVTVNFGTNQELGGANTTSAGGWFIVLPKATVEADGKMLVRDGALAM
jgi:leucyl aminopeptidase (aminopeptidase T)